jgi:hypothetical protein
MTSRRGRGGGKVRLLKSHEIYAPVTTFELALGEKTRVTVPGFEGGLGKQNTYPKKDADRPQPERSGDSRRQMARI